MFEQERLHGLIHFAHATPTYGGGCYDAVGSQYGTKHGTRCPLLGSLRLRFYTTSSVQTQSSARSVGLLGTSHVELNDHQGSAARRPLGGLVRLISAWSTVPRYTHVHTSWGLTSFRRAVSKVKLKNLATWAALVAIRHEVVFMFGKVYWQFCQPNDLILWSGVTVGFVLLQSGNLAANSG